MDHPIGTDIMTEMGLVGFLYPEGLLRRGKSQLFWPPLVLPEAHWSKTSLGRDKIGHAKKSLFG